MEEFLKIKKTTDFALSVAFFEDGIMRPVPIYIMLVPFLFSCGNNSTGPEQSLTADRNVLVALYNATDGANWTNRTNWLSDSDLFTWHGVTVSNERVIFLELANNNLILAYMNALAVGDTETVVEV